MSKEPFSAIHTPADRITYDSIMRYPQIAPPVAVPADRIAYELTGTRPVSADGKVIRVLESAQIKPSSDRKTRFYPGQKNTFGLLPGPAEAGGTCPGATTGPGGCWNKEGTRKSNTCYVDNLIKIYKNVYAILAHNTFIMRNADEAMQVKLLNAEFERFRKAEAARVKRLTKKAAAGVVIEPHLQYRLHWSGDIFDAQYARAIASSVRQNSDIHFWNYTRNFEVIPILKDIPNLTQYLSLDPVNAKRGLAVFAEHYHSESNLQICYMSPQNDFYTNHLAPAMVAIDPAASTDWITTAQSIGTCPVDVKKLPLEGGCAACQKCIGHKRLPRPIWFKT